MSMRMTLTALAFLLGGLGSVALAQQMGGGEVVEPRDDLRSEVDAIHARAVATARTLGLDASAAPPAAAGERTLIFPLRAKPNSLSMSPYAISGFSDRNAATGQIRDFACGSRTYDGHQGVDLYLHPFPWFQMDRGETEIIAAAAGTIVEKRDGEFDRQCAWGTNQLANYVAIRHDDGLYAYYLHMKRGSVTALPVGSRVAAADYLGLVGSSGRSSSPHLHFEMRTAEGFQGTVVEPFQGACGAAASAWKHQWPAQLDTSLTMLATGNAAPERGRICSPTINDNPHYSNVFQPGGRVYAIVALRDQKPTHRTLIEIRRPDGSLLASSTTNPAGEPFSNSYWWYRYFDLPTNVPTGVWKVRAVLGTQVLEHAFFVGTSPGATQLFGAIAPTGRSVRVPLTATMFATILNAGAQPAHGCSIGLDTPTDVAFAYQTTDPATNQFTGTRNTAVTIPANSAQTFIVTMTPRTGARADAWAARLRFRCTNAPAAQSFEPVNVALLSMNPNPVPDIIPIAVTPSHDQVIRLPGAAGSGFMAAAAVNIGAVATLTVRPRVIGNATAAVSICRTSNGSCVDPPAASVSHAFQPNAASTFTIFATAQGAIPFDPAAKRVMLDFIDAGGVIRGQTSAAIMTQ